VALLPWAVLMMFAACPDSGQAAMAPAVDPWGPIRFMVGTWRGQSTGQPGVGTTERTYRFEFGETYLRIDNKSVWTPTASNPKGEVHQDTGFFSFDKGRKKLVLRQFHSEGFVNQYVAELAAPGKDFERYTECRFRRVK
jgi:hypothetical protein